MMELCQCPTRANDHFYMLVNHFFGGDAEVDVSMPYPG